MPGTHPGVNASSHFVNELQAHDFSARWLAVVAAHVHVPMHFLLPRPSPYDSAADPAGLEVRSCDEPNLPLSVQSPR
jgi:hypothetical protein